MKETKLTISNKKVKVDLPLSAELLAASRLVAVASEAIAVTLPKPKPKVLIYHPDLQKLSLGDAGDASFDGTKTITRAGLPQIAPGGATVSEFLTNLFYPSVAPGASLQADNSLREMGAPTAVTLRWVVYPQTNPITSIVVNGVAQVVTATFGSESAATSPNTDTTFSMTVRTASETTGASQDVVYRHKRFWFTAASDLLNSSDAALSTTLQGASSEFATGRQQSRSFTLGGEYVYFAYLGAYGDASFVVGGLPNTAYQPRTFTYTNAQGYAASFRLYRSGNAGTGSINVTLN